MEVYRPSNRGYRNATWSNVGFGLFGKYYVNDWAFGYEAYLTNGFNDAIINNGENRTFLPASKANKERFEESSNGEPLLTGKIAFRHNTTAQTVIRLNYRIMQQTDLLGNPPAKISGIQFGISSYF
ncbi:MAG: hypothetical protein RLO17_24295 [Cyclobacteriaceae bacterium]|jgi:hypothetical protein|tara:strand:- start:908 stop:1285 length:378 start_codon:yes stop_codon:yes gene_type:complete